MLLCQYRWETVLLIYLNKVSSRRNSIWRTLPYPTTESDFCYVIRRIWCCCLLFFWKCAKIELKQKSPGNCFQYLNTNSLNVQSAEATSVDFLTLSNKQSLDVLVRTRTCRSCNVCINSHLAMNCMCSASCTYKWQPGICRWWPDLRISRQSWIVFVIDCSIYSYVFQVLLWECQIIWGCIWAFLGVCLFNIMLRLCIPQKR